MAISSENPYMFANGYPVNTSTGAKFGSLAEKYIGAGSGSSEEKSAYAKFGSLTTGIQTPQNPNIGSPRPSEYCSEEKAVKLQESLALLDPPQKKEKEYLQKLKDGSISTIDAMELIEQNQDLLAQASLYKTPEVKRYNNMGDGEYHPTYSEEDAKKIQYMS